MSDALESGTEDEASPARAGPARTRRPWLGRVKRQPRSIPRSSFTESTALQAIIIFKSVKCATLAIVGLSLLAVIGRHADLGQLAERIALFLRLDVHRQFIEKLIQRAASVTRYQEEIAAAGALGYSAVLAVEAIGLSMRRAWAAWLSAGVGMLLLPVEVYELFEKFTMRLFCAFVINLLIVIYLVVEARRAKQHAA